MRPPVSAESQPPTLRLMGHPPQLLPTPVTLPLVLSHSQGLPRPQPSQDSARGPEYWPPVLPDTCGLGLVGDVQSPNKLT